MPVSTKHKLLRSIGHQHWLRGRDRILRLFANPDGHPSTRFDVDFYGLRYSGDLDNFLDWTVFFYGAYSAEELELLGGLADALRAQGKPVNFFDVGANIGHHTLFMSAHADHVFSFEPYEAVRNEMVRKLKHAGVDHVTIFPVALGDKTETAPYRPPTGANQGTGTLGSQLPDNASKDTIPVSVIRGDDFFAANNLPPITLLKLDVEGFEVNVLEGLRKTLLRDRPPILMEIQAPETTDLAARKNSMVLDLLYPDHLLFAVGGSRQRLVLGPFRSGRTAEALVLPMELAGILPGTSRY